jgi:hypothetical protein
LAMLSLFLPPSLPPSLSSLSLSFFHRVCTTLLTYSFPKQIPKRNSFTCSQEMVLKASTMEMN